MTLADVQAGQGMTTSFDTVLVPRGSGQPERLDAS
jgi:hypothetical protein